MAGSRPEAGDKGKDGTDSHLKKPDAESLSRSLTDSSVKESKAEKKAPPKDVSTTDDKSADKFLAKGTVKQTLAAHVPAIGNVAKQDPQTASTYPQWADWHADKNDDGGDAEAAKEMREQAKKAREAILKEAPKDVDAPAVDISTET